MREESKCSYLNMKRLDLNLDVATGLNLNKSFTRFLSRIRIYMITIKYCPKSILYP